MDRVSITTGYIYSKIYYWSGVCISCLHKSQMMQKMLDNVNRFIDSNIFVYCLDSYVIIFHLQPEKIYQ